MPAGAFKQVLKTEETNPLKPDEKEFKFYAPRIVLIQDEAIKLVKYTRPHHRSNRGIKKGILAKYGKSPGMLLSPFRNLSHTSILYYCI